MPRTTVRPHKTMGTVAYRIAGKVLAPHRLKTGYLAVAIFYDGREVKRTVHQLVIEAFGDPKPNPRAVVRHLDDDKSNNLPANLAWGTQSDNAHDQRRNGLMPLGTSRPNAKLDYEKAAAIRVATKEGTSIVVLARIYGVNMRSIYQVAKGLTWVVKRDDAPQRRYLP